MSQSSDPEQNAKSPQPKIHQNSSGNLVGGQQAIDGNNNFQYQDNRTLNIYSSEADLPEELKFKSWKDLLLNYIRTLFFLFSVLISWIFMGLFGSHAFPKSLATALIQYTFHGFWSHIRTPRQFLRKTSAQLWEGIRHSIDNLPSLNSIEVTNDKNEAEKLNKLDSQYWLLARLAENFQEGCENFDDVFWKVRELEEQRNSIVSRLEPLKKIYFKDLYSFQNFISTLPALSGKSKKYDEIEKILNELVQSYVHTGTASELQIQELIEVLRDKTVKLPKTQSLYDILKLIDWIHFQVRNSRANELEVSVIDSDYPPVRALKDKQNYKPKYHVPDGCIVGYPKVEKPEDRERIDFYGSIEEAEKAGREICHNCRKKLNKNVLHPSAD